MLIAAGRPLPYVERVRRGGSSWRFVALGLASCSVGESIAETLARRYVEALANPDHAAARMAMIVFAGFFDQMSGQADQRSGLLLRSGTSSRLLMSR